MRTRSVKRLAAAGAVLALGTGIYRGVAEYRRAHDPSVMAASLRTLRVAPRAASVLAEINHGAYGDALSAEQLAAIDDAARTVGPGIHHFRAFNTLERYAVTDADALSRKADKMNLSNRTAFESLPPSARVRIFFGRAYSPGNPLRPAILSAHKNIRRMRGSLSRLLELAKERGWSKRADLPYPR